MAYQDHWFLPGCLISPSVSCSFVYFEVVWCPSKVFSLDPSTCFASLPVRSYLHFIQTVQGPQFGKDSTVFLANSVLHQIIQNTKHIKKDLGILFRTSFTQVYQDKQFYYITAILLHVMCIHSIYQEKFISMKKILFTIILEHLG